MSNIKGENVNKLNLSVLPLLITMFFVSTTSCTQKTNETTSAPTAKKKLIIATDATWPPMEIMDTTGQIIGLDIDIMKAIAAEAGFDVEFKNTAWDGIFAGLGSGKYDAIMSSVTITDERKKAMDFSDPYFDAGQVLIVPNASKTITALTQMDGKTVGAQIGTTGALEIKKNQKIKLKTYDEIGLAFEDLSAGRLDGVVADYATAINYALKKEGYANKFRVAGERFTSEFYGVAVIKGNKPVLDLINAGLAKIKQKATYQEILNKWLK